MLRNIIASGRTVEIYEITDELRRGSLVTKNLTTKKGSAASGVGVDVYVLDFDSQPTGHLSDVEISAYDASMDTVKANTRAILITYASGGQFATDQVVPTGLVAGDYAIAGTSASAGKFVKATTGKSSKYKYIGTYLDGNKTLYQFEVVDPVTLA